MTVRCSKISTILAFGLLTLFQHGERSLGKTLNDCSCIKEKQQTKDCLKLCHSRKKRSWTEDYCNFENISLYVDTNKAPGTAAAHVEYELDKSGKAYKSVNISWTIPGVPKSSDNSTKIADVQGFFVEWRIEHDLNDECVAVAKDVRYVILNSSHFLQEKINCDTSIFITVHMLPLPGHAGVLPKPFNCLPKNTTEQNDTHRGYDKNPPLFETVVTSSSSSPSSSQWLSSSQRSSLTLQKIRKDLQSQSGVCQSDVCKYAVVGSVTAVVAVIVVSIIFFVRRRRLSRHQDYIFGDKGASEAIVTSNKDFYYVSYFSEDGEAGDISKSVINFLMASGIGTYVAVNVLQKADLHNYYKLGPRKFSELYMQNACYVIVLVTKKYLDLCNVNFNVQLDKERRRVFEEIKYIERAQFEFGNAVKQSEEKPSSLLRISVDELPSSFEMKPVPEKKFITLILEQLRSDNLPAWMKGWPIYNWPKEKPEFLCYISQQG